MHGESSEERFIRELGASRTELRQAFARHVGMTVPRVQVILWLWRLGETSHSDLKQTLGLDGASVTRLVKELESEGLARRRPDPADNRYTLAVLTPAGVRTAERLDTSHQAFAERLLDGVTPEEQDVVLRVLRHLRTNANGKDST